MHCSPNVSISDVLYCNNADKTVLSVSQADSQSVLVQRGSCTAAALL